MRSLLSAILLMVSMQVFGQAAEELFAAGNEAYNAEKYEEAISAYQGVLSQELESSAIYFNLGNAYYKRGQLAPAMLNYERALKLSPLDEDIKQNIGVVQKGLIDSFERVPQPIVRTIYTWTLKLFGPDAWSLLSLIFFAVLLLGTGLYLFSTMKRPGFVSAIFGLVLGIGCLLLAFARENYDETHRPAIVMSASAYIKSGPSEKAEDVFILHEGTKAEVTEHFEGWKKIRLPDGKIGWIPENDIEEI